ncbi:type II secretion system F family protein [Candidatus Woesearchaeota archaeon]|nr:type II secretion system F family protein [Candidatus Woesearchaeota archaeon]
MAFRLQFDLRHSLTMGMGLILIGLDAVFFFGTPLFIPLIVVAVTLGWSQYWIDFFRERAAQGQYEAQFGEFVRNLVAGIKSGMPVSRAIIHVAKNDYGALSPHVKKLANQIEWTIPVHKALVNFGAATRNPIIARAISTVIEAEQSGGNIEDVLESITISLMEIKKIKQSRKASIQGQVIQSYIIFFVFLGVMIIIQNLLIPYISSMEASGFGIGEGGINLAQTRAVQIEESMAIDYRSLPRFFETFGLWLVSLHGIFLSLTLVQGLFAGLVIGKLSEGDIQAGIKHSLILMTLAFFVISLAQGF